MVTNKVSSKSLKTHLEKSPREATRILAPRDYFLGPVFAATKQTGRREVTIGGKHYLIGGFHPFRPNHCPPALDVRHARAIFSLLSFRKEGDPALEIGFSFNEFCRRYANSNGGRYARAILAIVADLTDAFIQVTNLETKIAHQYRLIERIDIEKRPPRRRDSNVARSGQKEMWFNGCSLSPEFAGLLNRVAELQHLDLDVFTSIRSPLAQAIYLYIPSRAFHHSENDPFEISLTKLLQQVSFPVPNFKSKRKELFTKHEEEDRSILQQLDKRETLSGTFRVVLVESNDLSDWKLQAWVEKRELKKPFGNESSKLVNAYLKGGRSMDQLNGDIKKIKPLDNYEIELLGAAKVEFPKNRRFFEKAKALLKGSQFVGLLAEAKGDELEGKRATKNPTARLIHRIMETLKTPARTTARAITVGLDNGRNK